MGVGAQGMIRSVWNTLVWLSFQEREPQPSGDWLDHVPNWWRALVGTQDPLSWYTVQPFF